MIFPALLVLFVVVPLVELALLIRVGEWLGMMPTLALVIATGVMGATLARMEGARVLTKMQKDLAVGRMPAPYILDGLMILVAGVLLITPGLITDAVGFALLVPTVRNVVKQWLRRVLEKRLRQDTVEVTYWEW
jgi:UPF0716 protein FxsA